MSKLEWIGSPIDFPCIHQQIANCCLFWTWLQRSIHSEMKSIQSLASISNGNLSATYKVNWLWIYLRSMLKYNNASIVEQAIPTEGKYNRKVSRVSLMFLEKLGWFSPPKSDINTENAQILPAVILHAE